jgi:microcystin-dependent protein
LTKRVQLLGHTAEVANLFIGEDREVTVDTDNRELRLHDEVTPGGAKILDRDANDNRYQRRSTELDGLLDWEPNEWGFVTRIGPGSFRLRVLTVNPDNLTVVDPDGHDNDPYVSLAPTVASDHTWSGENTFTQPITGTGGFVGDVDGDVVGNLTGNSAGTHTGAVVGDVTGNVTGNLTGGFDTTGAALNMDDESIDPNWIAGFSSLLALAGVPVGTVVAFALTLPEIPENWALCDGTSGTPDLRDRFIMTAGVDFDFGATGGSVTHTHGFTTDAGGGHAVTGTVGDTALTIAQMPAHAHGSGICEDHDYADTMMRSQPAVPPTSKGLDSGGSGGNYEALSDSKGGGATHTHDLTMDAVGNHSHTGTSDTASTLAPYLVLYYIMKVS